LETELLDKLIENIGTLASVYYQVPEKFVKKMRDMQNLRELEEKEFVVAGEDEFFTKNVEKEVEIDKDDPDALRPTQSIYLDDDNDQPPPNPMMNSTSTNLSNQANLINLASDDLLGGDTYTSTAPMISSTPVKTNIVIPPSSVLNESVFGMNNAANGLSIDAAFQRDGNSMFLEITIQN